MLFSLIGKLLALAIAVVAGFFQGSLFFSDPGPGETLFARLAMSVGLALVSGAVFGYNFRRLWFLAVIAVWMPILFLAAAVGEIAVQPGELIRLLVPVAAALTAARLGAKLKALKNLAVAAVLIGAVGLAVIVRAYPDFWAG
jgi:hypothetical protein